MKKTLALVLTLTLLGKITAAEAKTTNYPNTKLPMSTNMPVGSIYYDYLEKLDGLGFINSMLYGNKPYARVDMARWTMEARAKSKTKSTSPFIANMISELEQALAPEIASIENNTKAGQLKLHSISVEAVHSNSAEDNYGYKGLAGSAWQPFSTNNNGHHYGDGLNMDVYAYLSGNLSNEVAVSLSPRLGYDGDKHFKAALDEGYVASRIGIYKIEVGKQAMEWGQGASGKLALSNNARPFTMAKISSEEMPAYRGILSVLGKTRWTGFLAKGAGNRTDYGVPDYDDPYMVGVRSDFIYPNLTVGVARVGMLGGKRNSFNLSNAWNWATGKNDEEKWDNITGVDFRYRFPGMQVYGEFYGESQKYFLPKQTGYRGGLYFPRLTEDGTWDLTIEGARTGNTWYTHDTYQTGWNYHNDIMGDAMGPDAHKYYAGIKHYFNAKDTVGLHGLYQKLASWSGVEPGVKETWLSYRHKLNGSDSWSAMIGLARLEDLNYTANRNNTDKFIKLTWERSY